MTNIVEREGEELVREFYRDFAFYANRTRGLPCYKDGLKAVNRKIFYAMHLLGAKGSKFEKCLAVQGESMKFYVHGDSSLLDALYNLVLQSPYMEGQGNFGLNATIKVDAAAPRYTQVALNAALCPFMFNYIDEASFVPSEIKGEEPEYLIMYIPHCLVARTMGIGTGISMHSPTFRFTSLVEYCIASLKKRPLPSLVPYVQGNTCVSTQAEIDKLLQTGTGSISFKLDAKLSTDKTTITIGGSPVGRISLGTVIDKICEKFQLEYNDSSSTTQICVELKNKPYSRGSIPVSEIINNVEFNKMLISVASYNMLFVDTAGTPARYTPHQLLLSAVSEVMSAFTRQQEKVKLGVLFDLLKYYVMQRGAYKRLFDGKTDKEHISSMLKGFAEEVLKEKSTVFMELASSTLAQDIAAAIVRLPISVLSKDIDVEIKRLLQELSTVSTRLASVDKEVCTEYENMLRVVKTF